MECMAKWALNVHLSKAVNHPSRVKRLVCNRKWSKDRRRGWWRIHDIINQRRQVRMSSRVKRLMGNRKQLERNNVIDQRRQVRKSSKINRQVGSRSRRLHIIHIQSYI